MKSKRRDGPGGRGPARGELPPHHRLNSRWLLLGGSVAFALGMVIYSLLAGGIFGPNTEPSKVSAQLAPDVTLVAADGEFRLSEKRDKVLLLFFSFPG